MMEMSDHKYREAADGLCVQCGRAEYRNRDHGWELVHEDDCGAVLNDNRLCPKCGFVVDFQSLAARRIEPVDTSLPSVASSPEKVLDKQILPV